MKEKCNKCEVVMRPLKWQKEQFHYCPKCKWYYGLFYSAPTHPKNEKHEIKKRESL